MMFNNWIKKVIRKVLFRLGYRLIRSNSGVSSSRRDKLHAVKVYVGCGEDSRDGFLGCDIRVLPNVSVVCKAWEVSRHCVDVKEIYSRHTLEHLTFKEAEASLRDWFEALGVAGRLHIIVPNIEFHIEQLCRAQWSEENLADKRSDACWGLAGLYGWQRHGNPDAVDYETSYWDVHKSGYNLALLRLFVERAGFSRIEISVEEQVHLVVRATKTMNSRERQVAPTLLGIREDHLKRYQFASSLLPPEAIVLDVACGVGYGAYTLARNASIKKLVGIDNITPAIKLFAHELHFHAAA